MLSLVCGCFVRILWSACGAGWLACSIAFPQFHFFEGLRNARARANANANSDRCTVFALSHGMLSDGVSVLSCASCVLYVCALLEVQMRVRVRERMRVRLQVRVSVRL